MKTTFKQLLKFTSCTALMALFFSCTPATGGYTTDTGTGTTTTATTGGSSTGSGTDTGTSTTTTATTGDSTTGSGTDTGTGTTITGTSGVSFSTTYNDPTLPASVGTDPFKGHTYRNTYSSSNGSSSYGYTFGNNGELTYSMDSTSTTTSGTTTSRSGQKYSYSYDATTKELCLKYTHLLQKVPGSTEYRWYTYAELINYYLNMTISQLREMGNSTINTDEQLREYIQSSCISTKEIFESIYHYKAELNTSNDLTIRTNFYKTASFSYNTGTTQFLSYYTSQGSGSTSSSISFYLTIFSSTTDISYGSGTVLYSKGTISGSRSSSGTSSSKSFSITNISSNTISAEEITVTGSSLIGYTLVSDGITLQLGYTCSLGDDDNLLVTVTGSDDTTKDYLRTLLGDDTLTNPSITASSPTGSTTYPFVE